MHFTFVMASHTEYASAANYRMRIVDGIDKGPFLSGTQVVYASATFLPRCPLILLEFSDFDGYSACALLRSEVAQEPNSMHYSSMFGISPQLPTAITTLRLTLWRLSSLRNIREICTLRALRESSHKSAARDGGSTKLKRLSDGVQRELSGTHGAHGCVDDEHSRSIRSLIRRFC